MATTFGVLYLGTGPEIDTTEGNVLSEDDSALVGMTFGSAGTPHGYYAQKTLSPADYSGGTTNMYDIDNTLSNDTFNIDGGPAQTYDGLAIYYATLTYTDGTPDATITAVVMQDGHHSRKFHECGSWRQVANCGDRQMHLLFDRIQNGWHDFV